MRNIGPAAKAAIPALIQLAGDPKRSTGERQMALMAMGEIDREGKAILPALREALAGDKALVVGAAIAVARLGPAAAPLRPDLEKAARRFPGTYVRRALAAIGRCDSAK